MPRSRPLGLLLAVLFALCLGSAAAKADPINFSAVLTPGQEVPPPTLTVGGVTFSPTGTLTAVFDPVTAQLQVSLTWTGLTTTAVAAHIHTAPPGVAGPVFIGFFQGAPMGTSNTFNATISLSPTQVSGLLSALLTGNLYVNVHTTVNGPGEIRGNIGPVAIPEPATLFLLSTGLAGMAAGIRRRRKAHSGEEN